MKGAILGKGEQGYTCLQKLFTAIKNKQLQFNWLITDCVCYPNNKEFENLLANQYVWMTGEELTEMIIKEDFQWIWAVLSGFKKDIPLEEVLKYELPNIQDNYNFFKSSVNTQHPLTDIEITAWDSSYTILISKYDEIVDNFISYFPLSEYYHGNIV